MLVYFLFLIIVVLVLPADLKNYNVLIIPISSPMRKKVLEVFLLPRRVRLIHHKSERIHMEDFQDPTEIPDIDHFDTMTVPTNRDINARPVYRTWEAGNGKLDDGNSQGFSNGMQEEDPNSLNSDDRIVGGTEVDINMYPYHVGYGTNCGGTIIGSKWVLTAGHCGKKSYIRSGSTYLNQGKKTEITNHNIHPLWSAKNKEHPFDYDFQILELANELNYDENTQPIKVAHIEDMVVGKMITVTGWGNTEENGPYSSVLRAVTVPIIGKDKCQRVPFPYFRGALTPRMFCAGYHEGKKDACQGDSGGPAVAYDRLVGMVSFGYGCATPGSYGVYSKVAKVRDWIKEVTCLTLD